MFILKVELKLGHSNGPDKFSNVTPCGILSRAGELLKWKDLFKGMMYKRWVSTKWALKYVYAICAHIGIYKNKINHVNMCIAIDTPDCAYTHFKAEIHTKFYT